MTWILSVCTTGWLMCGMTRNVHYANKEDCLEAREMLLEDHGPENFRYVLCRPLDKLEQGE